MPIAFVAFFGFIIALCAASIRKTRRRRALPRPATPLTLPPPRMPFEQRLENGGFLVWDDFRCGGGDQPETLVGQLAACVRTQGTHIHNNAVPLECGSCGARYKMYGIVEIVKVPPYGGATDTGRAKALLIGIVCAECGYLVDPGWYQGQYQHDWHDHRRLREIMGDRTNFLEYLARLGSLQGAPLHEMRLRLVEAELETIEGRRARFLTERRLLQEDLGLLKGPPNRDRFPEDPRAAALDDAVDDRTRSLPALTDPLD